MWIIKSIGMGLLAVLAALVAFLIGVGWWVSRSAAPGESIGWDPVSMFHQQPLIWVAMCPIFVAGFVIGYRRHMSGTAH